MNNKQKRKRLEEQQQEATQLPMPLTWDPQVKIEQKIQATITRIQSVQELMEQRDHFKEWGEKHHWPQLEFEHKGRRGLVHAGELAWLQAIVHQDSDWIAIALDFICEQRQDHHHMELHYDDGFREIICTANPHTVRHPGRNNYAGFVGPGILAGDYCPICEQEKDL